MAGYTYMRFCRCNLSIGELSLKKILLVDDQEDVQRLLSLVLDNGKRLLLHAFNGDQALQIAEREQPDLVLLDVMMPGGPDGFEVAKRLRANPATSNCSIVFITAKVQEQDREKALEVGGDAFIAKPFSLEMLRETVEQHLALPR